MLGLHEHSLSYGQVAVERGTVSLNIMSQRENGFRVNSRAKGSTNAARRAIRVHSKARRASRVQFPLLGSHVSKAIYYFILNLVAIVRGIYIPHEDRVSVL